MSWAEPLLEWLRPIVFLVVLAGAVELALPEGSLRRYVEVVLGLVVLSAVLAPVLQLLQVDLPAATARYEARLTAGLAGAGGAPRAAGAAAGPGPDAPAHTAGSGAAADATRVFAQLLAREAERLARELPGVGAARAWAEVEPAPSGGPPDVRSLFVRVRPAGDAAGPGAVQSVEAVPAVAPVGGVLAGGAPPAGAAETLPPETVAAVRRHLAARLGIPAERIAVEGWGGAEGR